MNFFPLNSFHFKNFEIFSLLVSHQRRKRAQLVFEMKPLLNNNLSYLIVFLWSCHICLGFCNQCDRSCQNLHTLNRTARVDLKDKK